MLNHCNVFCSRSSKHLFHSPCTNSVVGIHQRPGDLAVNVCKTKQLTNMRSATKGITVGIVSTILLIRYFVFCFLRCDFLLSHLFSFYALTLIQTAPIDMSLDACVEYIAADEILEVTPTKFRMAKNPEMLGKKGKK